MTELTKGEQALIHECYKAKERASKLKAALLAATPYIQYVMEEGWEPPDYPFPDDPHEVNELIQAALFDDDDSR